MWAYLYMEDIIQASILFVFVQNAIDDASMTLSV
jgi:hypothetical protein